MTITNFPGDQSFISTIQLPDTNGGNVIVTGTLNPYGSFSGYPQAVAFTGSPVTAPTAPGSGSTCWLIEVNTTTGAVDVLSQASTFPANSAGCTTIFQQTLSSTTTDDALNSTDVTPDV